MAVHMNLENLAQLEVQGILCGVSATVISSVLPTFVVVSPVITGLFIATVAFFSEYYNRFLSQGAGDGAAHHYSFLFVKMISAVVGIYTVFPAKAVYLQIPLLLPSFLEVCNLMSLWILSSCGASLLNHMITPITPPNGVVAHH